MNDYDYSDYSDFDELITDYFDPNYDSDIRDMADVLAWLEEDDD